MRWKFTQSRIGSKVTRWAALSPCLSHANQFRSTTCSLRSVTELNGDGLLDDILARPQKKRVMSRTGPKKLVIERKCFNLKRGA